MTISPYDISIKVLGKEAAGSLDNAISGFKVASYYAGGTKIQATKTGTLSEQAIKNWIGSGIPIYAQLFAGLEVGHAVVVCGWATDLTGNMYLYIMNLGNGQYEMMTKNAKGLFFAPYAHRGFQWTGGSIVLTGWQKPYGGSLWAYMKSDGTCTKGWKELAGCWYYFSSAGRMLTGRQKIGDDWYYFNSTGQMLTGWQKIGSYWYYYNSTGQMVTGWKKMDGVWYYMDSSGIAAIGWKKIDGYWYSSDSSCGMRKGWFKDNGSWYYFRTATNTPAPGSEGAMLANGTWTIGGKAYTFNSSGVCLNP